MHRTKETLLALAIMATAALLIGGTVFANDVEAKSKKKYKANVELNYQSDCWTKTTVKINDGVGGKKLAKKSVSIDPESDESTDLFQTVKLKFKAAKSGEIQALVNIYDHDNFVESVYDTAQFSKSKKTYNFEFNGLVPC